MFVNESQIRALIRLLGDEDERIVKTISGKLIDFGDSAVPLLQEAEIEQPEMAERIVTVLEEIQSYRRQLDRMAQDVREQIGSRVSGEETVKALNRYLFTEAGFRGNTKNYYEVENSYLNCVMDRRTGIPISLSTVYLLIGKRLHLPVQGIGMPGHFLVKFDSDRYKIFIDCFNGGALLTEKNCARFLTEAGYGFEDRFLQKSPTRAILARMVKNLLAIYNKLDEPLKKTRLPRFIEILGCEQREEGL